MKAFLYDHNRIQLDWHHHLPDPQPGDLFLRVRMAGICRTDIEIARGYMGFSGILGHEFVGEVVETSGNWKAGTRVVGEINVGCGQCDSCRKGLARHCSNRTVLGIAGRDGCMAEYVCIPEENLYQVHDSIPDRHAVFTEPLAAVLEIYEQVHITPTDRICILGDGKLGLLTAMTLAYTHPGPLQVVGHHQEKLATVSSIVPGCLEQDMKDHTKKSWDIVIDATGSPEGLKMAMQLVRPRGILLLKSTMATSQPIDINPLVIDEIRVIGSRCGRFAPALSLLKKHVLPLDNLIERIYPLDEALQAWEHAHQPLAKKVLLYMGDG